MSRFPRSRFATMGAVVALAALLSSCSAEREPVANAASQDDSAMKQTITTQGTGRAAGKPDVATVTLGVETTAPEAQPALADNAERMAKVVAELKKAGIDEKDMQTSQLSIYPRYDNEGRRIDSYVVNNSLTVTVRDLKQAGPLIDAAASVAGDAVRVNSVGFSIDDPTELTENARTAAVKRARAQADQLAQAAGVEVGKVVSITEQSFAPAPLAYTGDLAVSKSAAAGTEVQAGSQEVSVTVQVVYELKN